jgi:hypothetical protein
MLRDDRDARTALALLAQHAERIPRGRADAEATMLRIEALLTLGLKDEALSLLDRVPLASLPNRDEQLVVRGELRAAKGAGEKRSRISTTFYETARLPAASAKVPQHPRTCAVGACLRAQPTWRPGWRSRRPRPVRATFPRRAVCRPGRLALERGAMNRRASLAGVVAATSAFASFAHAQPMVVVLGDATCPSVDMIRAALPAARPDG